MGTLMENLEGMKALLAVIEKAVEDAQVLQHNVGRGIGGRQVSLTVTKLEEAQHWLTNGINEREKA